MTLKEGIYAIFSRGLDPVYWSSARSESVDLSVKSREVRFKVSNKDG